MYVLVQPPFFLRQLSQKRKVLGGQFTTDRRPSRSMLESPSWVGNFRHFCVTFSLAGLLDHRPFPRLLFSLHGPV